MPIIRRNGQWLAIWILLAGSCLTSFAQTFDFTASRQPTASLVGRWRFHPGDNPAWASPEFDDSSWPLLESNRPWSEQGYQGYSGYAWYRFSFRVPAGSPPLSLLLPPIFTGYQLFVNGRRVGSAGAWRPSLMFPLPQEAVFELTTKTSAADTTFHIAVRIWHSALWAKYAGGGPYRGEELAGSTALILQQHRLDNALIDNQNVDLFVDAILRAVVGLMVFGLFLLRPREREYLWFAAIQIFGCAHDLLSLLIFGQSRFPIQLYDLTEAITAAGFWIANVCFIATVLRPRRGFWLRISIILVLLSTIAPLLYWWGWIPVPMTGVLENALVVPSLVWVLAVLFRHAMDRNTNAQMLLVPVLLVNGFYVAYAVNMAAVEFGFWHGVPDLTTYRIHAFPFDFGLNTLFNIAFTVALLAFLIRRFSLARGNEEHFEAQIEAARQVQQILVPTSIAAVAAFRVESVYSPAEIVGGDFFQEFEDREGCLLLVIGDVSGKGLPAAMMVAMLVGAIRAEATHDSDPKAVLAAMNAQMLERRQGGFATCLVARISREGKLEIANAGHLPPWLNGRALDLAGSLPLGIVSESEYATLTVKLSRNDRLVFVSDGVVEAQNPAGELLGFERTGKLSYESAAVIARAAQDFGQQDDITAVAVQFIGVPISQQGD
jgi:phosphoserine phosphatase RsbU/P